MNKIHLLGGASQRLITIKTARKLGYYTVLCDYMRDNPGQFMADKFYLISTTDKEAVLQVALDEHVCGVLAYASDPAAPTAAYVAEKLGLPTSPLEAAEALCNKDKFCVFLQKNGFNTPQSRVYDTADEVLNEFDRFIFPVIMKPVDSSSSKGATVLDNLNGLPEAIELAFSFSQRHRIIVEEYIEKKHPYLISGDVFVENGKIILWGLLNCHRDNRVNPLVPVDKSYPLELSENDIRNVKATLQTMVSKLQMKTCAMHIELVVDKNGKVWPIVVDSCDSGNMVPDLLGLIFDVNFVELAIKAAVGIPINCTIGSVKKCYAMHNIYSVRTGVFNGICYSEVIKPYIIRECIYKKQGDMVESFDNVGKAIGVVFLKFNCQIEM